MVNSSRGRPAGGSDARERLVSAATALFLEHGYAHTSSRSIAERAGASHSLVNYHFGSKEGLFTEVMAINLRPSVVIAAAFAGAGRSPMAQARHLVATALVMWDQPEVRDPIVALMGDVLRDDALRASIAEFFAGEILGHIRPHLGGADAARRANGIVGAMAGIVFTRYLLRVEPIASLPPSEVVATFAPSIAVHLR